MQSPAWSKDILASFVVFLVALPLCMGIAIASGVPPALGLITGIIGGLVVGFLAGSPLQVSGPAAGLTVLVYELVQEQGLAMLSVVILGAGAIQIVSGLFKLGRWFRAISPAVVHGMLAGIGVLIFSSQFHMMVDDLPRGNGLDNVISIPAALHKGLFPVDGSTHHLAAAIGMITLVTLIGWNRFRPEKLRMVPAPLVAVIVASTAAWHYGLPIKRIAVPANLLDVAHTVALADVSRLADPQILLMAFVFAFVASAETLLCATAVDQMHDGPRTDYDRELAAQGVGNMLCGALGALPMTGVIVRSSANVHAGAVTRWSAVLHGVWLLAAVAMLPWLLAHIPTACLAAILVYTGYKLVNITQIRRIYSFGKAELGIYLSTLGGIVVIDLLSGVLIGIGLAAVKLLYAVTHLQAEIQTSDESGRVDVILSGAATFLNLPKLAAVLDEVPRGTEAHVHLERLSYVDHACLELISSWQRQHQAGGGTLQIEWHELVDRYHSGAGSQPAVQARQTTLKVMGRS